jgi:hypothetical protein
LQHILNSNTTNLPLVELLTRPISTHAGASSSGMLETGRQPLLEMIHTLREGVRNFADANLSSGSADQLNTSHRIARGLTPFTATFRRLLQSSSSSESSEPRAAMERFFTKETAGAEHLPTRETSISLLHRLQVEQEAITYERVRDRYMTLQEETTRDVSLHHRQEQGSEPTGVRLDHRQPESSNAADREERRAQTVVTTPTVTVEPPVNPRPTDLSQVDIDRLVDRVYREFQKKLAFERSIRGI